MIIKIQDQLIAFVDIELMHTNAVIMYKNVFRAKYDELRGDEYIKVVVKVEGKNQELKRHDGLRWTANTYDEFIDSVVHKLEQEAKNGTLENDLEERKDEEIDTEMKKLIDSYLDGEGML